MSVSAAFRLSWGSRATVLLVGGAFGVSVCLCNGCPSSVLAMASSALRYVALASMDMGRRPMSEKIMVDTRASQSFTCWPTGINVATAYVRSQTEMHHYLVGCPHCMLMTHA